jgi:hypothetical protein
MTERGRWILAGVVVLGTSGLAGYAAANCMCLQPWLTSRKPRDMMAPFELVAIGKIVEAGEERAVSAEEGQSLDGRPMGRFATTHVAAMRLRVDAVWRGPRERVFALLVKRRGEMCGPVPALEPGVDSVVFANHRNGVWFVGDCNMSGAWPPDRVKWLGRPTWRSRPTNRSPPESAAKR